jgi:hypothetical protein
MAQNDLGVMYANGRGVVRVAVADTAPYETGVNGVHYLDPVPAHRVHRGVMAVVRAGPIEQSWNLPTL